MTDEFEEDFEELIDLEVSTEDTDEVEEDVDGLTAADIEVGRLKDVISIMQSSMVTKDALNDAVTEAIKDYDARRRVVEERVPMMYAFVGPDGTMPLRAKDLDACYDVYSAQTVLVPPGKPTKISTQLYLEVPAGWEVQIRPRSGLSINHGISVANTPGTVDATYTNEVCVGLVNHTDTAYAVNKGDRIAQIQYVRLAGAEIIPSPFDTLGEFHEHLAIKFGEDSRGLNGFGSTGK